ncbi:MAG: protein-L-isoaspartate(D-aspartate) O-methyltransferase [Thermodesulfobacteriota bacterium]
MSSLHKALLLALLLLLGSSCALQAQEPDWQEQRRNMVQEQLEGRDIEDQKVLRAMQEVPRHEFVPRLYQDLSYQDRALPIAEGQTISQPYIVALMTQLTEIQAEDKVLEIGTGSGYQAAVLAELAQEVYSVEIIPELAKQAQEALQELGYENVHVKQGDGFQGWPGKAPFEAILVTCAPPEIPEPLLEQLAPGGRLVIPVGERWQKLKVLRKSQDGSLQEESVTSVRFVPMTGKGVQQMQEDD